MPVVALLLLALVALAWGDALLRRLEPGLHGLQRFVIAQALGFACLSFLVLAIGWIIWTPLVAWLLLLALAAPGLARGRLLRYRMKVPVLLERWKYWTGQLTRLDRALLVSLGVLFGLFFLIALSPVIGWDATTHHYVLPQRFLTAGRVVPVPEIIFGNYPALVHYLYAWTFALSGVACTGLLNWYVALLVTLLLYSYGRTLHSRTAGLITAVTFMAAPTMRWITTGGYVDLYLVLYLLAGVVAWELHRREAESTEVAEGRPRFPWLAGVLLGCALGTKHLALVYCGCIGLARLLADRSRRTSWQEVGAVAGVAFALGLPWYLRSWINSGNPIDPFLPALFNPNYVVTNPVSVANWSQPTLHRSVGLLLTWPWRFVTDFNLIGAWYFALMPLPLALLPLPVWLREARTRRPLLFFWLIAGLYAACAVVLAPGNTRYALPAWGILCWLTGIVAGELVLRPLWRLRLVPLLIGAPVLLLTLILVKDVVEILPTWRDETRRETVLSANFPGYGAFVFANAELPTDAKVLCIDPRIYFLHRDAIVADPGNESHLAPPWTLNNTHHVMEHLRALGITHILLNETPFSRPEGRYLYQLLWHVEQDGLVVQTPQQASEWSGVWLDADGTVRPYMSEAQTRRYMDISRVDILPNADGRNSPGAVVRPDWIRMMNRGNRLPLMQGHLAAMQPILQELYRDGRGMTVFAIDWEAYDKGTPLNEEATLTWLFQGLPMPEAVARRLAEQEARLRGKIISYDEFRASE
ncbi:MAG: hypothetical protein GEEBNDBF_00344 [bacterium]|nr:hypothetical protein [bacterium]